jgi:EmrB/QacA subfamily drug resistance transporter
VARPRSDSETILADWSGVEEVPAVAWPLLLRDRLRRRVATGDTYRWWVLWAVLAGLFAAGFTITVLAVSLPTIARDLDTDTTTLAWIVTGPFLAHALGMPLLGKVGDRYGHRRVFLIGFALFTLFTGLTALAWSAPALITIRVIGALEGAATGPASMALIMHVFRAEDRVKAMGWWSLVGAGAPVIGLVAGGPIVEAFGWRWLFVMQVPIGLAALLLAAVVLRETPRTPATRLDLRGAAALGAAAVLPLLALQLGRTGWARPLPVLLLAGGVVSAGLFVAAERRAPEPLLPLEFFRRRNFSAAMASQTFSQFAYMGGFLISPLLMQNVFGYTVSATALVMLCRPLSFSASSPIFGYVAARVGERRASVAGTSLVVLSMACCALAAAGESVALVIVGLVLSGLGLGAASPSLISSAANAVEPEHLGVANGAQQMMTLIGAVAGMSVLATVAGGAGGGGSPFVAAYLVGLAVAVPGVVAATFVRSAERDVTRLRAVA